MRYLFTFLFSVFVCLVAYSQNDVKAKEILDRSAAKFKSYPAVEIEFSFAMENNAEDINESHNGRAFMKGNMYKLELMDIVNFYDGKAIYTYMPEVNEMNVKNPSEQEEEMLNPTTLFDIHNQGFKQKFVATEGGVAHIELFPDDLKKNFIKVGIWVNPTTSMIQKVVSYGKDGNNLIVTISSIKKPAVVPTDAFFRFDAKMFPGVEVIDLR